ncbi:hypothetical protein NE237_025488 [Protea cynaroides]|uniref:Thioesterase domain-containing protein n=1 Tax=Protea cynaroides TaxID=273540 RepID=A0A9Q0H6C2_9MAGN|nr:hypothetical protein NE237_025488 [Protea cynaroides]
MVNEEEIIVEEAKQWLEGRGQEGSTSHEIEYLPLCGIQVLQAKRGRFLCNLKVHPHLADRNGNCHAGAIATIIDVVGAAVVATYEGHIKEELEIEGKVVANRGKVSSYVVEVRRKEDGMLLALEALTLLEVQGRFWATSSSCQVRPVWRKVLFMASGECDVVTASREMLGTRSMKESSYPEAEKNLSSHHDFFSSSSSYLVKDLQDRNGNCHAGAIATIIDVVEAAVISCYICGFQLSVDFNISYFSTVKIQEELEIEGKVVANRGKFSSNVVEVRRKEDGMLLALGKQWMAQKNAAGLTVRTRL